MNGSDLRSLAERASALEDRTPDRLAGVHERVAAVRRRRRVAAVATAVAAVLVVLLASVVLVSVDPTKRTPDPAPTPDPQSNADAHRPSEGTCWRIPAESLSAQTYWHDDSPQVPCRQVHNSETVVVLNLSEPTVEEGERTADQLCREYVLNYLGVDQESWIPWGWIALLPSEEQIEDGSSWMRCDAVFPTSTEWAGVKEVTGSAAGAADDPPADLWSCLDEAPTPGDHAYVPCDRPHAYEQTGKLAGFFGLTEFPSKQERTAAEAACDEGIPARLSRFEVVAFWEPRENFVPSGPYFATCYVHDPSGGLLPPRPASERSPS